MYWSRCRRSLPSCVVRESLQEHCEIRLLPPLWAPVLSCAKRRRPVWGVLGCSTFRFVSYPSLPLLFPGIARFLRCVEVDVLTPDHFAILVLHLSFSPCDRFWKARANSPASSFPSRTSHSLLSLVSSKGEAPKCTHARAPMSCSASAEPPAPGHRPGTDPNKNRVRTRNTSPIERTGLSFRKGEHRPGASTGASQILPFRSPIRGTLFRGERKDFRRCFWGLPHCHVAPRWTDRRLGSMAASYLAAASERDLDAFRKEGWTRSHLASKNAVVGWIRPGIGRSQRSERFQTSPGRLLLVAHLRGGSLVLSISKLASPTMPFGKRS